MCDFIYNYMHNGMGKSEKEGEKNICTCTCRHVASFLKGGTDSSKKYWQAKNKKKLKKIERKFPDSRKS